MGGDEARDAQPDEPNARADRSIANAQANRTIANARALTVSPRAAILALAPLAVIVLGFITPPIIPRWMYSYGAHVHFISPYEDGASILWSIQLVAAVLAAITIVQARRRGEPGVIARIVATVGALAVLHLAVVMLYVARGEEWPLTLSSAAVVAAAIGALVQAWRTPGWRGWLWALAAYAIAGLPYACPLWAGMFNEFSGGVTFVAADATLLALAVMGLRRQQRR